MQVGQFVSEWHCEYQFAMCINSERQHFARILSLLEKTFQALLGFGPFPLSLFINCDLQFLGHGNVPS